MAHKCVCRRVLVPDKHGAHFPLLEEILNFLTLPF